MARGWRVLDATSFEGVVGGTRGHVTFESEARGREELPAEDLAVILIGGKTTLTSTALHYVTKHDIALLAADWRGIPFGGFFPWADHTRVGARHIAQADLSLPRRKNARMQIIKAKIVGQAATLEPIDWRGADHLTGVATSVRSGDPSNSEGAAARFYWARLFPAHSRFVRDQNGRDPLNGALNYGYTVLRGFCIRSVLGAGLAPPVGLFHRGRSNYFNLVDDLIEPFRPAIDHTVANLPPNADLSDPSTKKALVASAVQPFRTDGARIPAVMDDLAQQLGRYVEGDIDKLKVTPWSGPKAPAEADDDGEE